MAKIPYQVRALSWRSIRAFPKWLFATDSATFNESQLSSNIGLVTKGRTHRGNKYIASGSSTKSISTTVSGLMSIATHHIEQIPN